MLAKAARIAVDWGYSEINLNCGCPSYRVQAGSFGACLMREPALVADCVAAMAAVVSVPVTVKCRLGVNEDDDYGRFAKFVDWVSRASSSRMIVVHARNAWLQGLSPKENREIPPLRYDWVYRLKRERPELAVVLNGGITSVEAGLDHLLMVDGVMLGRAAYQDPYILHQFYCALSNAPLLPRTLLLRALRPYVEAWLEQGLALRHIVRHLLGLFHGQPGGRVFRQVLTQGGQRSDADWSLVEQALSIIEGQETYAAVV